MGETTNRFQAADIVSLIATLDFVDSVSQVGWINNILTGYTADNLVHADR